MALFRGLDISARDFMPVQVHPGKYVQFRYEQGKKVGC
jgi:hypothetical protein